MGLVRLFLCALGLAVLAGPVRAWDSEGHEQIADIAWVRLTPHARAEVRAILTAGDPMFRPAGATDAAARAAFRLAATFPDYIKGNRDTVYEPILPAMNLLFQPAPDPSDREGVLCKTWHYYDTPIRYRGRPGPPRPSNALKALDYARAQLAAIERAPSRDRRLQAWWLCWAEHLVGDVHQPLHCVSAFDREPRGDNGGNGFKLGIEENGRPTSLHYYWDAGIGHARQADAAAGLSTRVTDVSSRWLRDRTLQPTASEIGDTKVADWIAAGAKLADTAVYAGVEPGGAPSAAYQARQSALCRRQAVLAGLRLARMLNAALGATGAEPGAGG